MTAYGADGKVATITVDSSRVLIEGFVLAREATNILDINGQKVVPVEFFFESRNRSLLWDGKEVVAKSDQPATTPYVVKVPFTPPMTRVTVTSVDGTGKKISQTIEIAEPRMVAKRHSFSLGLGPTSLVYQQTAKADLSQIALSIRGSYNYQLVPGMFDLAAYVNYNLVPLSTNQPGVSARVLGLNLRFGYIFPFIKSPWSFRLFAGYYYISTKAYGGSFGFSNLMGPQLYPVLTRVIGKSALYLYGKYSPIMDGFKFTSLSNREVATGFGVIFPVGNGKSINAAFDYVNVTLVIAGASIQSNSLALALSYGF